MPNVTLVPKDSLPAEFIHAVSSDIRDLPDQIPAIENLDAEIIAAIENGGTLYMPYYHGDTSTAPETLKARCGTVHCIAGWAVHLAGEAGYALEDETGSVELAAGAIFAASDAWPPPPFYDDAYVDPDDHDAMDEDEYQALVNEAVMDELRHRVAARETQP